MFSNAVFFFIQQKKKIMPVKVGGVDASLSEPSVHNWLVDLEKVIPNPLPLAIPDFFQIFNI